MVKTFAYFRVMCHIMKSLLSAITTLIFINCFSQEGLIFPFADTSQFDWNLVEKKPSKFEVDKFIKSVPKEFQIYKQRDPKIAYWNLDSLRKDLHFLDLNGDGKNDVVFEGQSGGERREVIIFMNVGSSYKKVLAAFQTIVKMEWHDKQLKSLYIYDWGCCEDYIDRRMIYEASYSQTNFPIFKKIYQGLSIHEGVMPDTFLEKPFRFEILNEGYKIRIAPQIDDTSFHIWTDNSTTDALKGTTIGKLTKGATGTAIAKKQDSSGRAWLFVQLDEAYIPKNNIIYIEDKFPAKLFGWISSRFVKTL
jgi:hypothetical protein